MIPPSKILATAALAIAIACGGPAHAGDGDYEGDENHGPVLFGQVADARGKSIADARVVVQAKNHEPLVLTTTRLGLYRTHVAKGVRPEDVEVSCQKDGYRMTRVQRRGHQANCTLEAP